MDESRKAFEYWLEKYHGLKAGDVNYANMIEMYWQAWKASRAAIELNLPTENELHQKVCSGCASDSLEMVEQAIRSAGLKIKE